MSKNTFNSYWLLLLLPLVFFIWYFAARNNDQPLRTLPYFGPKGSSPKEGNAHKVGDFSFTDQNSKVVDQSTVAGKVYVAEFFFSTCKSICPVMNSNLVEVYREFGKRPDFMILSHTVDPEIDNPGVLKAYAESLGINGKNWFFLTGPEKELYEIARKGYILNAEEGDGGDEDFIHTQNFALVDRNRSVRGYYDGTDSLEVIRLKQDIGVLLQEK